MWGYVGFNFGIGFGRRRWGKIRTGPKPSAKKRRQAMTAEEMEHAINFLLDHRAKVSGDIERLTADVQALREAQAEQGRMLESVISEMRDGFNNLIVANEVTRKLNEDIARLTI
jgi:hypothetical protein